MLIDIFSVVPDITKPLEARDKSIEFDKSIGKVTFNEGEQAGGFFCDVCSTVFRDSNNYLDHLNGKMHIRMMGMAFKTKRSTLKDVRDALQEALKNKKSKKVIYFNLSDQVEKLKKEEEDIREQRKLRRKEKKRKRNTEEDNVEDDEIARMMGFSSFGSSKK